MVLDFTELLREQGGAQDLPTALGVVLASIRETDLSGWYKKDSAAGAILTEIPPSNFPMAVSAIDSKLKTALLGAIKLSQINKLRFSFHVFPETPDEGDAGPEPDMKLYPDLAGHDAARKPALAIKRMIDIGASLALLAIASPVMGLIALAVKATSRGPVLFRQQRLGRYGRPFTFLKFRSMWVNNDPAIHREYVRQFISGTAGQHAPSAGEPKIYKLTRDPRVTRVGRFLRKTSLDELPQLWNVLAGQMSLVGPRPPLPYEFASYSAWHRRRLFEARPGVTGLWQVSGRSRTKFDEMVRLDLRYAKSWSLALDLRILLRTPRAVFSGSGAC